MQNYYAQLYAFMFAEKKQRPSNPDKNSRKKAENGKKGGEATKEKYGSEYFKRIGKKGGTQKRKRRKNKPNDES